MRTKHGSMKRHGAVAAFTLLEVMVAAGVLAIGLGSLVAVNSQATRVMRRSASASFASQLIQERMEQFRRAAWTEITSNYPPDEEDTSSSGYDGDSEYIDDPPYPTQFPYDLADLSSLSAGMNDLMAVPTASAQHLKNVIETVRVEAYNAANTTWTGFDWDGSTYTLAPNQWGGRPIVVRREGGAVFQDSHNVMLAFATTVRLTFNVTWTGSDGVQRTKETITLFTVEGDK